MRKLLLTLILPFFLVTIWQLLFSCNAVDRFFLPSPYVVFSTLIHELISGELLSHLLITLQRALLSFLISAILTIPLGLLIGRINWIYLICQPTLDFFRSIPATALFPLFLLFLDVGDQSKIAATIYACSLIILVNTSYGAKQINPTRILSAKVMGISRAGIFWKIVLPESTPGILSGLRLAISMSLVIIVVTEMFIGTNIGIGYFIVNSQMIYNIPEMYSGVILIGLVGFALNRILLIVEKKKLHWIGK